MTFYQPEKTAFAPSRRGKRLSDASGFRGLVFALPIGVLLWSAIAGAVFTIR